MIDERRRPPAALLAFVTIAYVDIGRAGIAEVVAIERAVGVKLLCIDHTDGVASLTSHANLQPAGHVLANIDYNAFSRRRHCQVPPPVGGG